MQMLVCLSFMDHFRLTKNLLSRTFFREFLPVPFLLKLIICNSRPRYRSVGQVGYSGVPRGVRGVRTAPGDTLRGVTPELVFSVKNRIFFKSENRSTYENHKHQ